MYPKLFECSHFVFILIKFLPGKITFPGNICILIGQSSIYFLATKLKILDTIPCAFEASHRYILMANPSQTLHMSALPVVYPIIIVVTFMLEALLLWETSFCDTCWWGHLHFQATLGKIWHTKLG